MAKKKRKKSERSPKNVIAVFTLSTGYEVPIEPMDVKKGGLVHLARAIIGETVAARAKEYGWDDALEVLGLEISDCLIRMPLEQRDAILKSVIWETVVEEWGKLEKSLRKK